MQNTKEALAAMIADLKIAKAKVQDLKQGLKDYEPENYDFEAEAEEPAEGEEVEESEEVEEKPEKPKIETKEDAKKVLEEAKKDVEDVEEALDGILGEAEEEEKVASFKRASSQSNQDRLATLANQAKNAIADAKDCVSHWSFLMKHKIGKSAASSIASGSDIRKAEETLKEAVGFVQRAKNFLGLGKQSTAVPPDRSEFTGDKWPGGKNPAEVELRHWQAGASEFKRVNKKYNEMPNPATDERYTDEGNPDNPKPYVNATLYVDQANKFASYWDVVDTKSGKGMRVSYADLPDEIGPKNASTFGQFTSKTYGAAIIDNVMARGIEDTASELNARPLTGRMVTAAKKEHVTDYGNITSYYADAYGDRAYARKLTATKGGAYEGMEVNYKPEHDDVSSTNKSEEFGKAKDGPGKLGSKEEEGVDERGPYKLDPEGRKWRGGLWTVYPDRGDGVDEKGPYKLDPEGKKWRGGLWTVYPDREEEESGKLSSYKLDDDDDAEDGFEEEIDEKEPTGETKKEIIRAKARRAVDLALKFAAVGQIEFNKQAVYNKAKELLKLTSADFLATERVLDGFPIVNEAALKTSHIPDVESGIVGNRKEGVSEPKATVKTEDVNSGVERDAKISSQKVASVVPQLTTSGSEGMRPALQITTLQEKLQRAGISGAKLRLPVYKQR